MKNHKFIFIISLSLLAFLLITTEAFAGARAGVRIILRPWWPLPIVIAPPPIVIAPPPVVRVPKTPYQRPPIRPVADVGYIHLNVQPMDANVYVDGEYMGIAKDFSCTPHCLTLIPGTHSVSLRKEGYKTAYFTTNVLPRHRIEMDVALALFADKKIESESTYQLELNKTGFLVLQVTPEDASVYIDGNFYGIASQFVESQGSLVLRSGKHKIELAKPGYLTYTKNVKISDGKVEKIIATLRKSGS
ncbi:MAG: hypothetical protein DRH21_03360 [Deltaproteobacteria bacterium]|nr:MAG: hypothetical protein DRH21_03360 [Deltaproteobacteria bacterium]